MSGRVCGWGVLWESIYMCSETTYLDYSIKVPAFLLALLCLFGVERTDGKKTGWIVDTKYLLNLT